MSRRQESDEKTNPVNHACRARALFQIVRPDLGKTKTPLRSWRLRGSIPYLEKKMMNQPQQTNPNDHRYYPEDEIELMDYLLVIWKWKYLILAGTFSFALTTAHKFYLDGSKTTLKM